jgi:hypothetical protein
MTLSEQVNKKLKQTIEVHTLVLKLAPGGTYQNTPRNGLFHALCDLEIEHFGAIITLVQAEQYCGSASALLRPLIESCLRALWLLHIADDAQAVKIAKGVEQFPGISNVYRSLRKDLRNSPTMASECLA